MKNSHCVKSVQIRSFFWFVFSSTQSQCRKIRTKKLRIWTLFTQCHLVSFDTSYKFGAVLSQEECRKNSSFKMLSLPFSSKLLWKLPTSYIIPQLIIMWENLHRWNKKTWNTIKMFTYFKCINFKVNLYFSSILYTSCIKNRICHVNLNW